jgi:ribosomal protein S27AE
MNESANRLVCGICERALPGEGLSAEPRFCPDCAQHEVLVRAFSAAQRRQEEGAP